MATTVIASLSPVELLALSKIEGGTRPEIHPGDYDVDFNIRIKGSMRVGEGSKSRYTSPKDLDRAFLLALNVLTPAQHRSLLGKIKKLGEKEPKISSEAKEVHTAIRDALTGERAMAGRVTSTLRVESVVARRTNASKDRRIETYSNR